MSTNTDKVPRGKPAKARTARKQAKRGPKGGTNGGRANTKPSVAANTPTGDAPSSKKEEIVARLRRAKGVSLAEIQKLTGWQKHTVRGFISVLGSKAGLKIISTRNDAGERNYRVAK
jgi:hypothetical protein